MIKVEESETQKLFVSPWFFERTEKIRKEVVDCTREELIDGLIMLHQKLEKYQGLFENLNDELEKDLGWREKLA